MMLNDILQVIEKLSAEEVEKLQAHLDIRNYQLTSGLPDSQLLDEINLILEDAEPVQLQAGTLAINQLKHALNTIRKGLSEAELEAIATAMNEETVESEQRARILSSPSSFVLSQY